MRHWGCLVLLILAACGSSPSSNLVDRGSPDKTPGAASKPASVVPSTKASSAEVKALLEAETTPRQKGPFAPTDDCAKLPGAEAFRQSLATAVAAKDANAIASLALPTVRLGFGGSGDGRERFRELLVDQHAGTLAKLVRVLPLGCAADVQGGMTIPSYFAQDMGDIDSYSAMLTTGTDVPLFSSPDPKSPVKEHISWDLVTLAGGLQQEATFQRVTSSSGQTGYISTDKLRSLLALRILAEQSAGQWRISAVVEGD